MLAWATRSSVNTSAPRGPGGAIPLSLANSGIRAALGSLFTWKFGILLAVIVLSVVFYRPFCKWLCPLGAFYALLNKVSLFQMKVDKKQVRLLREVRQERGPQELTTII